jgi:ketosteroid isomerase-like protein
MARWRSWKAGSVSLAIALTAGARATAQVPAPAAQPGVMLPPPLARVLSDYEAAWQKKDAAALSALFVENGLVLASGSPPVRGRDKIRRYYGGHGGPLSLRAYAFATEGSVGYIIGGFANEKGQPDIGKFTLTLRKSDEGRWLIMSDMDNGNGPAR